jgi:hypothetical protein
VKDEIIHSYYMDIFFFDRHFENCTSRYKILVLQIIILRIWKLLPFITYSFRLYNNDVFCVIINPKIFVAKNRTVQILFIFISIKKKKKLNKLCLYDIYLIFVKLFYTE